jgi:hypothetical protein
VAEAAHEAHYTPHRLDAIVRSVPKLDFVFGFNLAKTIHENTRSRTNESLIYRFVLFRGKFAWQAHVFLELSRALKRIITGTQLKMVSG